jgi:glycosyltransferase involved in cell wall biosynthesis
MRILQLTAFYLPSLGGIQYYVRNLSQALTDQGHAVDVLTVNTEHVEASEQRPEGTIYRCALDASYHRGLVSRELIGRLLCHRGYDVMHVHIPFPLGLEMATLAARLKDTPLVVTHHGTGKKDDRLYTTIAGTYDMLYRNVTLRGAKSVVFLTESYRGEVKLPSSVGHRTQIVRTGADIHAFNPHVDGSAVRTEHGLGEKDVVALWVGSLNEHNRYKGVNYLIDALTLPPAQYVKLLVVGGGPLQNELKARSLQLGLEGRVRFAGAVENSLLPGYYAASDFFVLPSISGPENSPVVVFEAMASGKPIIASDIAGVREIVDHEQTGLLALPRNVQALADALGKLARDTELRSRLGEQARARSTEHSWQSCALQMERIYHSAQSPDSRPFHLKGATDAR